MIGISIVIYIAIGVLYVIYADFMIERLVSSSIDFLVGLVFVVLAKFKVDRRKLTLVIPVLWIFA
jgi:uncharacterized membrane protein YccC